MPIRDEAPRTRNVGDVIADLYEVTDILGDELAVRRFLREAEPWVGLDLHPHIASCYYQAVSLDFCGRSDYTEVEAGIKL